MESPTPSASSVKASLNVLEIFYTHFKAEIKASPEELERFAVFLKNNTISFEMVNDLGNHSMEDSLKYKQLLERSKL